MEYRTIDPDELTAFSHAIAGAFHEPVPDEDDLAFDLGTLEPDRCFVATEDGRIVGTTGVYTLHMTVPGGATVATAGVTTVGVLPTHRRRGIMTELMTLAFAQARERGEPFTALFAAEAAIYRKLGFGPASWGLNIDVDASRSAFHAYEPHGRSRLVPHTEATGPFLDVYRRATAHRPGIVAMDEDDMRWITFEREPDKPKHNYLVHVDDGGIPDAVAKYRVKHRWPDQLPHVELKLRHLYATTSQAWADAWRYLLDLDLVSRVKAPERPVDDPIRWLLREPRALRASLADGLFARPLDISATLAARTYAADGRAVIEVHDPSIPENDGSYELSVHEGAAIVVRTTSAPDLECDIRAVGATYLGGVSWSELARAGAVAERRPGAAAAVDRLFTTAIAPWSPVDF